MKIYIAGPMTGYKEFNFAEFFKAEDSLILDGHETFNPARHDIEAYGIDVVGTTGDPKEIPNFDLKRALKWDLNTIFDCDGIYMLKGWEKSSGARVEHALATAIGLEIIYEASK